MAAARCPKCGTVVTIGAPPYPRCRRCEERLNRCRYCRFYDARMGDCTNPVMPEDFHVTDADQAANCPEFATTLGAGRRRPRILIPVVVLLLCGAGVYAGAQWYQAWLSRPRPVGAPSSLMVDVTAPDYLTVGEEATVALTIRNGGKGAAEGVVLGLRTGSAEKLELRGVRPEPQERRKAESMHFLSFPRLGPGEQLSVNLVVRPRRPGRFTWPILVFAEDSTNIQRVEFSLESLPAQ